MSPDHFQRGTLPSKLVCPKCGSADLNVLFNDRIDRLLVVMTGKLKYRCLLCAHQFRAKDRRRVKREGSALESAHAAGILRR